MTIRLSVAIYNPKPRHGPRQPFVIPGMWYVSEGHDELDPDFIDPGASRMIDAMMAGIMCNVDMKWTEVPATKDGVLALGPIRKADLLGRQFPHGAIPVYLLEPDGCDFGCPCAGDWK